jgi:hypothetical protein
MSSKLASIASSSSDVPSRGVAFQATRKCRQNVGSPPGDPGVSAFWNRSGHSNARAQRERSIGGRRRLWDCGENRCSRCGVDFIAVRLRTLRSRKLPARAVILTAVQEPSAFMERYHLVITECSFCGRSADLLQAGVAKCRNPRVAFQATRQQEHRGRRHYSGGGRMTRRFVGVGQVGKTGAAAS